MPTVVVRLVLLRLDYNVTVPTDLVSCHGDFRPFLLPAQQNIEKRKQWKKLCWFVGGGAGECVEGGKDLILTGFQNYTRILLVLLANLLELVAPLITGRDTNYRKAIPAEEKLPVTFRSEPACIQPTTRLTQYKSRFFF